MTYKELGDKTLITKGTLTGVIDRLEQKGLVARERCSIDKRSFFVRLSPAGDAVFHDAFPRVIAHGKQLFAPLSDADFDELDASLRKLKQLIVNAGAPVQSPQQQPQQQEEIV
jgi:DNA-binding MarR family transcriptional regulator